MRFKDLGMVILPSIFLCIVLIRIRAGMIFAFIGKLMHPEISYMIYLHYWQIMICMN